MRGLQTLFASGLLAASANAVAPNCVLHQAFPKPKHLGSSPAVQEATKNLTAAFNAALLDKTNLVTSNNSWSIEAWSIHEEKPIWTHYHAAYNLEDVNVNGTTKIDGSTVYRLGSLTKIFTVLTWLVEDGDKNWFTPITEYLPELRDIQAKTSSKDDPVRYTDWDAVTVGALAGQMSGIPRDYGLLGELTQDYGAALVDFGFPPPAAVPETPPCGVWRLCNRTELFEGLVDLMPVFRPDDRAAYSNIAYILLAWALEKRTGKDWETLLKENVLEPLGLDHTYYATPDDASVGVIPGNAREVGWTNRLGDEGPSGSMLSSSNDITVFGKAILSSKLVPEEVTRRWIRPVTFTSDPQAALGAPWGIRRINMGHPYNWIFGYQKAGRIGDYSSLMILLPDYDMGFTVLTSGNMPVNMNFDFADTMGAFLLPAVKEASRQEADQLYSGHYVHPNSTFNSSLTISTDDLPGLNVERWISNGTDMRTMAVMLQLSSTVPLEPRIRMFPTGLETVFDDGSKKVAFKATFEDANGAERSGRLFSTDCASWLSATSQVYAARSLDEFVFHIDADGTVVSVDPVALRNPLEKTDEPPAMAEPPAESDEGGEEGDGEEKEIPEAGADGPADGEEGGEPKLPEPEAPEQPEEPEES